MTCMSQHTFNDDVAFIGEAACHDIAAMIIEITRGARHQTRGFAEKSINHAISVYGSSDVR